MKTKLLKLLTIPALVFSLNNQIEAQEKSQERFFQLQAGLSFRGGINYSTENMVPYENWKNHFQRNSNPENFYLTERHLFGKGHIDFALDPTLNFKKFKVGGSIEGSLINTLCKLNTGKLYLHGWVGDSVTIQRKYIKQISPSLGAFIDIPLKNGKVLNLKATWQKYKTGQEKRQDKGYTTLKCEEPINYTELYTEVFENEKLENMFTKRFSINLKIPEQSWIGGIYYETDFNKFHEFGLRYGSNISTK